LERDRSLLTQEGKGKSVSTPICFLGKEEKKSCLNEKGGAPRLPFRGHKIDIENNTQGEKEGREISGRKEEKKVSFSTITQKGGRHSSASSATTATLL